MAGKFFCVAFGCCVAFAFSSAIAQQPVGWIADARTGCLVWNLNPNPNETITWSGTCPNMSRAEGQGTLQWFVDGKPTERYVGKMRDGKYNGRGKMWLWDAPLFEGEFKDSLPHGQGTYFGDDGVYQGTWTNGCFREGERKAALGASKEECGFR
jgi:hypothetical protein